jgi:LAO/AO transport system kinase
MQENLFYNLLSQIQNGSVKALARGISLVENQANGFEAFLQQLPDSAVPVIGITGPPGAGKSTLVDGLVGNLVQNGKKVGILCVDPSSPFNLGALLGDRIRMSKWYNNANVFIRSLASRGSVGGLHPSIIEITDLMKTAGFDIVIVETVGVGQSEIEIAGLADITVVTLVPEAGDEIQVMKAGLMEIADIFVVNKADRPNAEDFVRNLRMMLHTNGSEPRHIPVLKTVALNQEGITDLAETLKILLQKVASHDKKEWLLAERAFYLVQKHKMAAINKAKLKAEIARLTQLGNFNMYRFIQQYF